MFYNDIEEYDEDEEPPEWTEIVLDAPEIAKAGRDAVINFTIRPANSSISNPVLKKVLSTQEENSPSPPILRTVDRDDYYIDFEEGKIVFPDVELSDAGTYEFSCDEDYIYRSTFRLNVEPKMGK